jgi:hypothetical protein
VLTSEAMKKTMRWGKTKLSLSPETVRTLTVPELARAAGAGVVTISDCVNIDDDTKLVYTETGIVNHLRGTCMNC